MKIIAVIATMALAASTASAQLYWTENVNNTGTVHRADLDGNGDTVITSGGSPNGIEVIGNFLYWPDQSGLGVRRSNLDGSNATTLVSEDCYDVDASATHLYWTTGSTGKIRRSGLNGSGAMDHVTGISFATAVDATPSHLYWAAYTANKIQRSNLDGTGVIDLITNVSVFDFEVTDTHIYFADLNDAGIRRADLNGSNIVTLVSSLQFPNGIEVTDDKIYFSELFANRVARCDLDGNNLVDLATGLESPRGVAVSAGGTVACALSPLVSTNNINSVHAVTATVTFSEAPVSGVTVNFEVTSGPQTGQVGTDATDANGQAAFSYTAGATSGTDVITASGTFNSTNFTCTATAEWIDSSLFSADLFVSKTANKSQVVRNKKLTYTVAVTNNGPDLATGVVVTDTLPLNTVVVSGSTTPGYNLSGRTLTFDLGALAAGEGTNLVVAIKPKVTGKLINKVNVTANEPDSNTTNNFAKAKATVIP